MRSSKKKRLYGSKRLIPAVALVFLLGASGCGSSQQTGADEEKFAFAMQQEHRISDSGNGSADVPEGNLVSPDGNSGEVLSENGQALSKNGQDGNTITPTAAAPSGQTGEEGGKDSPDPLSGKEPENNSPGNSYEDVSEEVAVFLSGLTIAQEGRWLTGDGGLDTYFYMQIDERWGESYYGGTDTIAKYACGPTSMSIVISSLTDIRIDPVQMSSWAKNNGYWFEKSGSLHSLIPDAAEAFGLKSEGIENTPQASVKIKKALEEGKFVVALMGKGQFTQSGHFIVLRGLTEDGKVMVADPASEERTEKEWDLSTIVGEAKTWAAAGGPFWIIGK